MSILDEKLGHVPLEYGCPIDPHKVHPDVGLVYIYYVVALVGISNINTHVFTWRNWLVTRNDL
jgi:hypothetical protein